MKINVRELAIPDFRILKLIVNKIVWYWCKGREIGKWNRIEIPKTGSCMYDHLIFVKNDIAKQWEMDVFINY